MSDFGIAVSIAVLILAFAPASCHRGDPSLAEAVVKRVMPEPASPLSICTSPTPGIFIMPSGGIPKDAMP